jgi:hypothetical protein
MKKANLSKYFLFISIFTFIAIFFFIVQNSYDAMMKPITQVKINPNLKPIDPKLDITILDTIAKRQYYSADLSPPPATNSSQPQ